jgi:uncharacterized membrane protein (DUF485 family)
MYMQIYRVIITFVLLGIAACNTASATSPRRYKSELDQRQLKSLIEIHHHTYGEYPVSDDHGTWFEKLSDRDGNIDWLSSSTSNDGKHLLGEYGFPIVFEPPSFANGNQIVIRDVGENGIDDNGLLDDWDSRYGPQMGYWYKKRWPGVYRRAVVGVILAVAGGVLIQRKTRGVLARLTMFSFWFSFLLLIVLPWVGSRGRYHDLEVFFGLPLGMLLIVVGFLISIWWGVAAANYKRYLITSGYIPCAKCNYDLRGTIAANIDRCPECGESVPEDSDVEVDLT